MLSAQEVAEHNSRKSCWVIISGEVYDVTDILDDHPGGDSSILRYGGRDATTAYEPVHPVGTIQRNLPKDKHLGPVDVATIGPVVDDEKLLEPHDQSTLMDINLCQNLDDLEAVARQRLSEKAWVYFDSAADGLYSVQANRDDWSKITFRPRVLRDVAKVSMERKIMAVDASLPFFIAPAAMAKLGHPDGEKCLAEGAKRRNIVYCASTYSSVAHEDLASIISPSMTTIRDSTGGLSFQLYVPKIKEDARQLIEKAKNLGCTSLVITVDTPVVGKRESDERYKAQLELQQGNVVSRTLNPDPGQQAPILRGHHSSTVSWDDIIWMKECWGSQSGPVILKGISTAEDAMLAAKCAVDGIYLSNHGGRQLDYSPSPLHTLCEIRKFCPKLIDQMQIYLDGGIRRGSDVIKALCLGATGVGLGRPFLYALSAYGTEGVLRAIQLLSEEIETTMRLLGVTNLSQLNANYVNTKMLDRDLPDQIDLGEDFKERARL